MAIPNPARAVLAAIAALAVGLGVVELAPMASARTAVPSDGVWPSFSSPPPVVPAPKPTYLKKVPVSVTVSPGRGAVVGVAYPITVTFSRPVNRRLAQAAMIVSTSRRTTEGVWSWTSTRTAIYRTRAFWPAYTTINVSVRLSRKFVGTVNSRTAIIGGRAANKSVTFRTSRAQISYINGRTDRMSVFINGKRVKKFGVSLGKPGFLTRSGIKVTTDKYVVRRMTSRELGLRKPNEQYDLQVPWAVRITPTGEFVHGAPWAAGRIGHWNGSHGCTNLLTSPAKWFYQHTIPGDPVITVGTGRKMEPWNGLGGPWNVSWAQWRAHSYPTA